MKHNRLGYKSENTKHFYISLFNLCRKHFIKDENVWRWGIREQNGGQNHEQGRVKRKGRERETDWRITKSRGPSQGLEDVELETWERDSLE